MTLSEDLVTGLHLAAGNAEKCSLFEKPYAQPNLSYSARRGKWFWGDNRKSGNCWHVQLSLGQNEVMFMEHPEHAWHEVGVWKW